MYKIRRRWLIALLVLTGLSFSSETPSCPWRPQEDQRPSFPVEEWISGPERRDLPVRIEVKPPYLTYQQRYLVEFKAYVDSTVLFARSPQRDLYFILKIADGQGRWFEDETYNHYLPPLGMDTETEIQFAAGIYARPGNYTVAVLVYDATLRQLFVWRRPLRVPAPKNDPLPNLDRDLPAVEFLADVPQDSGLDKYRPPGPGLPAIYLWRSLSPDSGWELGHGREWLPVRNTRPLRLDLIVNLSDWIGSRRGRATAFTYRQAVGSVLQIGSVLSHLGVDPGCVRVSELDSLRTYVFLDRGNGPDLDWEDLRQTVGKLDTNVVDVRMLRDSLGGLLFLRDHLSRVMSDSSGCNANDEPPKRAIILVVSTLEFPEGTKLNALEPVESCACPLYYFHISSEQLEPAEIPGPDKIAKMLKATRPKRYSIGSPRSFRKALADMLADLNAMASAKAP